MKRETNARPRENKEAPAPSGAVSYAALSPAARARAQQAYERIAGDEGLTGSLPDAAARQLLNWAQHEIVRLAAATEGLDPDEAGAWLAPQLSDLRRRLRHMAQQSADAASPERAVQALLLAARTASEQGPTPRADVDPARDKDGSPA
ncbi:MAG: hypothetical protein JXC32_10335 [Anaerolineae bacterium]|nr:hypothetical protein [Anaerolineae bacterium]